VGTDLFELNKNNYLLVVDYFSRYPEVVKVTSTTSASIIAVLKSIFARHGIPEIVRSDNGPQYSSAEFMSFASSYGFQHITSSPKFPQSNGQAERCVQTVKNLLKKSDDPNVALLSYRSTPLSWCDLSPAELCMGRRLRTSLPLTDKMIARQWPFLEKFREQDRAMKEKQKENFDSRHRAKDLPTLPNDTDIWIMSEDEPVHGQM
jgi:transposase InsO family protein